MRRAGAKLGLILAMLFACNIAHADPFEGQPEPRIFGDWAPRTRLYEKGIDFQLGYVSELAYNAQGGIRNLTDYTDQIVVGATFNLERLFGFHDAVIQVTYTERAGRNLVDDAQLGTLQLVQEVYGRGQTVRLTQLWFEQEYFSRTVAWKVGRMTVGEDFAVFPCHFQNLTFCGSDPGNLVGGYIFNWPISQWATRVKVKLDGFGYYQVGVYDQNQQYLGFDNKLWPVFYQGSTGVLVPVELAWLPTFDGGRLPGSYKIGAWYSTSTANDVSLDVNGNLAALTGMPPLQRRGLYGGFFTFQQQVTRNASENPEGGLKVFVNGVFADTATSTTDQQFAAGLQYTGPISWRPNDVIAFAAGTTHVNNTVTAVQSLQNSLGLGPVPVKNSEYVFELYYQVVPTAGLLIRPNVQYIYSPGGSSQTKDIWVLGLKTVIRF